MNKEELKKKIVEIIHQCYANEKDYGYIFDLHIKEKINAIADALIAAGIGDVKTAQEIGASATAMAVLEAAKAEHRAARAERALDKATELAYTYRTQDDTLSCSSCPFDSIFDRCKERGLYENCSKRWKEELLQQSEKELQEEQQ